MDIGKIIHLLRDPLTKAELSVNDIDITNAVIKLLPADINKHLYSHYNHDAEIFDYFEETNAEKRLRQTIISKVGKITKNSIIMDIGSGAGWVAKELTNKCLTFISIDISDKNLARIQSNLNKDNHYAIQADVMNLPFADDSIDIIISSAMLEHIPHPERALQEMYRIIKPAGKIIIETPYKEKIKINQCIHCNKPTPANAHLHSFDETTLSKLSNFNGSNIRFSAHRNKLLALLRIDMLFNFLPFCLWLLIDNVANVILNKRMSLIMIIKK